MRLWSIHPSYLDQKGLCGLWAESLLAQACLLKGEYTVCSKCLGSGCWSTNGECSEEDCCSKCKGTGKIKTPYYNHPQLERFKDNFNPNAINVYLYHIWYEANKRGYKFNHNKIPQIDVIEQIKDLDHNKLIVTKGQLDFEYAHLQSKLRKRDYKKFKDNVEQIVISQKEIKANSIFKIINGNKEEWERG